LEETWLRWQDLVAEYKSRYSDLPRDLYLVLLLSPDNSSVNPSVIERVTGDTLLCRKLVVFLQNGDFRRALQSLPFISCDVSREHDWVTVDSIVGTLQRKGYPGELVQAFGQRISAQKLADNLLETQVPANVPSLSVEDCRQSRVPGKGLEEPFVLRQLTLKDFRGLRHLTLDLAADLVVVYGRNGTGKTSVFEAIEWGLLGAVDRLDYECPDDQSQRSPYVNLFSEDGLAAVELVLSANSTDLRLRRSVSVQGTMTMEVNGKAVYDEHGLIDELVGVGAEKIDLRNLKRFIRTTNFLAQTTLKEFLSDAPRERYASVSYLLGTHDYGRYLDKLASVEQAVAEGLDASSATVSEVAGEIAAIKDQIRADQRVLEELQTGRQLIKQLREVVSSIREILSPLDSQIASAIPARVEDYNDVRLFPKILEEWIRTSKQEAKVQLEKLTSAIDALEALPQYEKRLSGLRAALETSVTAITNSKRSLEDSMRMRSQQDHGLVQVRSDIESRTAEIENCQVVLALLKEREPLEEALREQQKVLQALSARIEAGLSTESQYRERVRSLGEQMNSVTEKLERQQWQSQRLSELNMLLSEWSVGLQEEPVLRERAGRIAQDNSARHSERDALLARLGESESDLKSQEQDLEYRKQSLARIQQLLLEINVPSIGSECPLCGHDWEDSEALRQRLQVRVDQVPTAISDLNERVRSMRDKLQRMFVGLAQLEEAIKKGELLAGEVAHRLDQLGSVSARLRSLSDAVGLDLNTRDAAAQLQTLRSTGDSQLADLSARKASIESAVKELETTAEYSRREVGNLQAEANSLRLSIAASEQHLATIEAQLTLKLPSRAPASRAQVQERCDRAEKVRATAIERRQQLETSLMQAERRMSETNARLETEEKRRSDQLANIEEAEREIGKLRSTISDAGLASDSGGDHARSRREGVKDRMAQIEALEKQAALMSRLASWLATEKEIKELHDKKAGKEISLQDAQKETNIRRAWKEHLGQLYASIVAIRGKVENWKLEQYAPTINTLYQRLNTHPLFGPISASVDSASQSLTVQVEVSPYLTSNVSFPTQRLAPARYFSEAQLNVLALSIFLTHALQQRWSRFFSILLDDPVQNMDDYNANALIDTLRAFVEHRRQFALATCDLNFYRLMLVKLKCLNQNGRKRFAAYRLEGVSSRGPALIQDV
jgi:DNA repair exonuclease SbcCD ATPase subunit